MGPEAGLAMPDRRRRRRSRRVDAVAAQRPRPGRGVPRPAAPSTVRLTLGGVGGAFGAREDVSLHVHACLLALRTGRPVKIVYSRDESFLGHVHRHPARIWMRHTARPDGEIVSVEARIVLDGGAYRSSSYHVTAQRRVLRGRARTACRTRTWTRSRCARTIRRAARCAASVWCRRASRTRRRWTSSPTACGIDPVELRAAQRARARRRAAHRSAHRQARCRSPR